MGSIKGSFSESMKDYYAAEIGGYTAITDVEIRKQTFYIKKCIKDVLLAKLSRSSIPVHTDNRSMSFKLSESLSAKYGIPSIDLICKFSKPNKDEMTLYFSRAKFLPRTELTSGDIWCIYFKPGDNTPWFDYVKKEHWSYVDDPMVGDTLVEPDEVVTNPQGKIELLKYDTIEVKNLTINEVPAPVSTAGRRKNSQKSRVRHIVSTSEMKKILKNQKVKGVRGEEIVLRIEKERLTAAGKPELSSKVKWVSKRSDGYGYDIESYEYNSTTSTWDKIYIEVKSTSQLSRLTPFYVSENEKLVSKEKGSAYYIYRVFAMTKSSTDVSYYRIKGPIEDNFSLHPCSYTASRK